MSAVIERDPFDNRWFSKRKATQRIDPLVALAMAVGAATARQQRQRRAGGDHSMKHLPFDFPDREPSATTSRRSTPR
jgi:phage terminase large subunit-like protein